jgi:hypothetical protein
MKIRYSKKANRHGDAWWLLMNGKMIGEFYKEIEIDNVIAALKAK